MRAVASTEHSSGGFAMMHPVSHCIPCIAYVSRIPM
jgi:hypothetical protein